ncbi:MAG: PAS domain S-box protein [Deltaproteobacteria bacterium]|nr:PAS domain S-box protein [Deltaproteobacteria bacterium]
MSKIIEEKLKVEQELRIAEEKYRNLFENAPEGIYETTQDGKFRTANPKLAKILGYESPEELIESVKDISTSLYVDPTERRRFKTILEKVGRVEGFETQFRRKDGKIIWVSLSARVLKDERTGAIYYEGTCEDITEKKQMQAQIFHAQKLEALGTLTGGIAHDFNNILTIIKGYATILASKMEDGDFRKVYVDQILQASEKAYGLIRDLLAFSRKQPIKLEPVDLPSEIKRIEKLLRRLLPESIELEINSFEDGLVVMADKTQISQILFNLTTNARDAMPDGGKLTVNVLRRRLDSIFVKDEKPRTKDAYAIIEVSDTGCGIEENVLPRIFDPFFTTKEPGKGTGLGLASVYGTVKQHGGYVTVKSTVGKGTTFRIYLPLVDIKFVYEEREDIPVKGGSEKILVVEDDSIVRSFVKEALETHGYTVFEAKDGEEALKVLLSDKDIRLVITDIVMPKKGGIMLYREATELRKDTKFLFVSGYPDQNMDFPAMDHRYNFLSKPLSYYELLSKVRELLDECFRLRD